MNEHRRARFVSVFLVLAGLLASGCTHEIYALEDEVLDFGPPRGEFLASFMISGTLFAAPDNTGFAFYLDSDSSGQFLLVYDYSAGKIVDEAACGHEATEQLMIQLTAIGLEPFDYHSAVRLAESALRDAGDDLKIIMVDGAGWRIQIETSEGPFIASIFNPAADLANFAELSENLANLEAVLDLLSAYYGRCKISLAHRW